MTEEENNHFIENVLKDLWPSWEPKASHLRLWRKTLSICDYGACKRAINDWFAHAAQTGREPVLATFNKIKVLDPNWQRPYHDAILLFALARIGKLNKENRFFAPRYEPPHDVIEAMAESHRKRAERMYGGQWVVIRYWDSNRAERTNSLLVGMEAKRQAEANVLAGEDSPGRRFLLRRPGAVLKSVNEAIAPRKFNKAEEIARMTTEPLPERPDDDIPF